jgi:hypothetical protein
MTLAYTPPPYQFNTQISGNGNIYSSSNTVDFCGAYNSIDVGNVFGQKIAPCPTHLKINETFTQVINEQITVMKGSVINGSSGNIALALNTQIPNSGGANLQYILFFGSKSEPPFMPQSPSPLGLGKDDITGVSVPFTSFAGGLVEDLTDLIVTYSGISQSIVSPIVNKIIGAASISGHLSSVASLTEQVTGTGFGNAQNVTWSSDGIKYLNLSFNGEESKQTLYLTPISKQNLSLGFGVSFLGFDGDLLNVPIHPVANFSNFKGSPLNLSWDKVVIDKEGTGGSISPTPGMRWYVQGYEITLNVTSAATSNSFKEFKIYNGDSTFSTPMLINKIQLPYTYTVKGPAVIEADFANAPTVPIWEIIAGVVIFVIVLFFLLRIKRR